MATTTETTPTVAMIPLDKIVVVEGHNPRREFDEAELAGLTASVSQFGVIQPILVSQLNADGKHEVIAGERRFRAATAAKLAEIPALVGSSDTEKAIVALVENLERVNLNPIEEAAAFQEAIATSKMTKKALAAKVNKSPSVITEALALLELPANAQKLIADRVLPPASARFLRKLAKVSAPAAAHAAEVLVSDSEVDRSHPERSVWEIFAALGERVGKEIDGLPVLTCCVDDTRSVIQPEPAVVWPEDKAEVLVQLRTYANGYANSTRFERQLQEAAASFGCTFELSEYSSVILDADFVVAQAEEFVKRAAQAEADRAKERGETPADPADVAAAEAKAKEAKRQEREKKADERVEAIDANGQLGVNMVKKLGKTKVTTEFMKMLAAIVLQNNRDLPGAGLALCDPAMRKVEVIERKNGTTQTKAEFTDSSEARNQLIARIEACKTPEEVAAHLLSALIAGRYASSKATTQADYRYWGSHVVETSTLGAGATLEKLALPVLPTAAANKIRERRAKEREAAAKKPAARKAPAKKPAAAAKAATPKKEAATTK